MTKEQKSGAKPKASTNPAKPSLFSRAGRKALDYGKSAGKWTGRKALEYGAVGIAGAAVYGQATGTLPEWVSDSDIYQTYINPNTRYAVAATMVGGLTALASAYAYAKAKGIKMREISAVKRTGRKAFEYALVGLAAGSSYAYATGKLNHETPRDVFNSTINGLQSLTSQLHLSAPVSLEDAVAGARDVAAPVVSGAVENTAPDVPIALVTPESPKSGGSFFTLGRALKYGAGVPAAVYLPIVYALGKWPFKRINEKVFIPTQLFLGRALNPKKGPVTCFLPWPIVKFTKDIDGFDAEGKKVRGDVIKIPAFTSQRDIEMKIRTAEGFAGIMPIQYAWRIPNKKAAKRFYWNARGDIGIVDEMVNTALNIEISKLSERQLRGEEISALEGAISAAREKLDNKTRERTGIFGRKVNVDETPLGLYGVYIEHIAHKTPDFDEKSKETILKLEEARREGEALSVSVDATVNTLEKYFGLANKIKEKGSALGVGDIALILAGRENAAEIARAGGTGNSVAELAYLARLPLDRLGALIPGQEPAPVSSSWVETEPDKKRL